MKFLLKVVMLIASLGLLAFILVDKYNMGIFFSQIGEEPTIEKKEEYIETLREAMLQRQPVVELRFKGKTTEVNEFVGSAIDEVFAIDNKDTSSDFDYLKYCYKGTEITIHGILDSYTVRYSIEYNETLEQTEEVDNRIAVTLGILNLENKSDYEKIKAIHDYIIINASYDVEVVKNSGYDNLINKRSVCQGYALIAYKMMTEAGIDCRIITGTGKGVSHAWNIVKLDGQWYNIDCTWDDPVSSDKREHLEYDYFLKSDQDFLYHERDEEFQSAEFYEQYNMAQKSY